MKVPMKQKNKWFNRAEEELARHRKKWLPDRLHDRRSIRGLINAKIKEAINPRNTGDQTADESIRKKVLNKTQGRCAYCLRHYTQDRMLAQRVPKVYFNQLEIDHIVAHSRHGPNAVSNYLPACRRCNQLKSNLSMAEFSILLLQDQRKRGY
jgi:hypothetical protein